MVILSLALPAIAQSDQNCSPSLYFLYRGEYDRALAQAPPSTPDAAAADANVRGVALMMKGDTAGAAAAFRKALQSQPEFFEARFNLGVALLQQREFAGARAELRKVFDSSEGLRPAAAYHLGLTEQRAGDLKASEAWLRNVVTLDPGHAEAWLLLGIVLEARGDLQGAGKSYLEFLRLRPGSAVGHLRFGVAAMRAGKIDTARRYLRHTIELAPASAEATEARKFLVVWE